MAGDPCAAQRAQVGAAEAVLQAMLERGDMINAATEGRVIQADEISRFRVSEFRKDLSAAQSALEGAQTALERCEAEHSTPPPDDETRIEIG
jgi:hypothetical protein